MTPPSDFAAALNRNCHCAVVDVAALQRAITRAPLADEAAGGQDARMPQAGAATPSPHRHLFTDLPYFISQRHERQMREVIAAIEHVAALPAYRRKVLADAPVIARRDPGVRGVLFGYDFHLTAEGPKLIEINTNAGGALLNLELLRMQSQCCDATSPASADQDHQQRWQAIFDMFASEWRMARGSELLRRIAIVDETPAEQYLYPEFLLFQRLFEQHGIEASIVSPHELSFDGALRVGGRPIDLVYNRLTDFYFRAEHLAPLRDAYLADAVVVTPHPFAHALYADKRNLTWLSNELELAAIGADPAIVATLAAGVPRTVTVHASNADQWWAQRKGWFFKPVHGFGSRGVYRGDKLTRGAFASILSGDYIAQRMSPPSERATAQDQGPLKVDIRNYVYEDKVLLLAARTYRGQTTNFRTAGGGFAPLFVVPETPTRERDCPQS